MKAAGRRIDPWNAAWYDLSLRSMIEDYFNTGDITVYDSTLKILRFSDSIKVNVDDAVDQDLVTFINENYDYIALRPSNYIHEEMAWGYFLEWLEALKLPVICLGIGAQAATRRKIVLRDDHLRIWKIIAERTTSIGVRGSYSAAILNDNGIANVEIVGCPTLFRHREREITLRYKELTSSTQVAFSLRRETSENYTPDVNLFLSKQKRIISLLDRSFSLVITAHGESEEKAYYYNDLIRKSAARKHLTQSGWFDPVYGPILEQLYASNLFFTHVPAHYDEFIAGMDFAIGYRVHGVLPALAAGTPSVLLRYDARSEELAETLHVPLLEPDEVLRQSPEETFTRERFADFEKNFSQRYDIMKAFLEQNDIAHRM